MHGWMDGDADGDGVWRLRGHDEEEDEREQDEGSEEEGNTRQE